MKRLGGFPQTFIDEVRNAGDIARVVSDYVPLKKAGSRLKGLCPFHQEKTPSFSVDPTNQLFYCFGCQTGGDLFKFVMSIENIDFTEAVRTLAQRFGVPVPETQRRDDDPVTRLLEMNLVAAEYFRSLLHDEQAGKSCRDYLAKRGLRPETIDRLGLGYAPDAWEGLRSHLLSRRFKPEELVRGGLVVERKSGTGQYDRFRDRLIFPIRDVSGRVVAFGGRAIGDAEPKYINSPETPTYTKGDQLYGLDLARQAIRREGYAVVVEGYLDFAALREAGIDHVVASLGTAFTPSQAGLLGRYADRLVVSYDGDAAGAAATARSLDLLLEKGFKVRVVDLPAGIDPDDCIRQEGAAAYTRRVHEAPEYLEFLIRREVRTRNLENIEEKVAAANALLPHIAKLDQALERVAWAGRVADALQIDDGLVLQELRAALRSAQPAIRHRPRAAFATRETDARIVSLLLRSEEERRRWADELAWEDLEGSEVAPIVKTILELAKEGRPVTHPTVRSALEGEADRDLFTRIAFREEPDEGPSVEDCLWACRRERLTKQGREIAREIGRIQKDLGSAGAASEVDEHLMELQRLARQRDALQ